MHLSGEHVNVSSPNAKATEKSTLLEPFESFQHCNDFLRDANVWHSNFGFQTLLNSDRWICWSWTRAWWRLHWSHGSPAPNDSTFYENLFETLSLSTIQSSDRITQMSITFDKSFFKASWKRSSIIIESLFRLAVSLSALDKRSEKEKRIVWINGKQHIYLHCVFFISEVCIVYSSSSGICLVEVV